VFESETKKKFDQKLMTKKGLTKNEIWDERPISSFQIIRDFCVDAQDPEKASPTLRPTDVERRTSTRKKIIKDERDLTN